MFRRHILRFKKSWRDVDGFQYVIVTDDFLVRTIIETARFYDLKIKRINLSDLLCCVIVVKGSKDSYLCFVESFLQKTKNLLEKIRI